jgi:hypothetical protein
MKILRILPAALRDSLQRPYNFCTALVGVKDWSFAKNHSMYKKSHTHIVHSSRRHNDALTRKTSQRLGIYFTKDR